MIGKLSGFIDEIAEDYVILNVNQVGYLIFLPNKTIRRLKLQDESAFYINTIVREDCILLYGFKTKEDMYWFNQFKKISGIGSKSALAIIGEIQVSQIISAIMAEDVDYFKAVNGIGAKTAKRIVTELKSQFNDQELSNLQMQLNQLSSKSNSNSNVIASVASLNDNNMIEDAVSALENLGYNRVDAFEQISNIVREHKEAQDTLQDKEPADDGNGNNNNKPEDTAISNTNNKTNMSKGGEDLTIEEIVTLALRRFR